MLLRSTLIAAIALATTPAFAHVTLEQNAAPVGSFYKAVLKVPHGCEQSATVKLRVTIPEGVIGVKPMVKPGWKLEVKRGAYAKTYSYLHGAKFSEGVREVTWSGGNLPDAFYDEFVISAFIAGELTAGETLYFPVVQECEKGAHHWVTVPCGWQSRREAGDPAPGLKLLQKTKGHGE